MEGGESVSTFNNYTRKLLQLVYVSVVFICHTECVWIHKLLHATCHNNISAVSVLCVSLVPSSFLLLHVKSGRLRVWYEAEVFCSLWPLKLTLYFVLILHHCRVSIAGLTFFKVFPCKKYSVLKAWAHPQLYHSSTQMLPVILDFRPSFLHVNNENLGGAW